MAYIVQFKPAALRNLERLPTDIQLRIARAIDALVHDPFPSGSKKMRGLDAHRIRIGDYRVVYQVHARQLLVLIIRVGHRREVYR